MAKKKEPESTPETADRDPRFFNDDGSPKLTFDEAWKFHSWVEAETLYEWNKIHDPAAVGLQP